MGVDPGLAEWMSKPESAFRFMTANAPTEEVESDHHRHLGAVNILEAFLCHPGDGLDGGCGGVAAAPWRRWLESWAPVCTPVR